METYQIVLICIACALAALIVVALLYKKVFKRVFDVLASAFGLILAAIPMAITAVLVKIYLGSPVIFKQERVGKNQKRFYIYKFRTMTDKRDENGELLPDSERFTKFGKLLRKTSLDELPQLINVLKGDISLIGPRPMMPKYIPSDIDTRAKRFSIRPGITGAAQINGRTNITYAERFAYDVAYADKISLWTDIKLFFGTAMLVLKSFVKKGSPAREEDMEMLNGTLEYERRKALENGADPQAVRKNKVIVFGNEYSSFCNYRLELLEELKRNGHRVVVVVPGSKGTDTRVAERCDVCYDLPMDNRGINPLQDLKVYAQFKKILKKERPDVVLTIAIKPNVWGGMACASAKVRYFGLIQGLGSGLRGKGITSRIAKMLCKLGLRKSQAVFVEGDKNADKLVAMKLLRRDHIIPLTAGPGVSLERFEQTALPQGEKTEFLFMSRILKEKGVDELLQAFTQAKEKYADRVGLTMIGRCVEEYEPRLRELQEKGILQYAGFQKDIQRYLQQAHCIVLPSYHEGVSIALLEGMATGRPIITTDADGCVECVLDGENGFMVPVADTQALYEAVCKFVELPFAEKQRMADNARAFVENGFDRKQVNRKIEEGIGCL